MYINKIRVKYEQTRFWASVRKDQPSSPSSMQYSGYRALLLLNVCRFVHPVHNCLCLLEDTRPPCGWLPRCAAA